jgi:hypothetical protein
MTKIASSPDRHTFQQQSYIERQTEQGQEIDQAYVNMWDTIRKYDREKLEDPKWREYNLEYDLRTTDWIIEKCKKDSYAQNLYAAICNNDFAKFTQTGDRIETYRNLREEYWSASWRSAGGIIADVRGEGDYIDWYCSGIGGLNQEYDAKETNEQWQARTGYVPESVITDEIRADLAKLGWVVIPTKDD